jgi:hypothetical protein
MKTLVTRLLGVAILTVGANGLFAAPPKSEPACSENGPVIKNLMALSYRTPWAVAVPHGLTKKDAKRLSATAERREDHLKLAAYYKAEADRLDAEAAGYENAAAAYRRAPIAKNLAAPSTPGRYEFFAKGLRNEAKSDRALATSHEEVARDAVATL